MSKKSRAEWNILINSTNTKSMNIFGVIIFSINAFLYTLLGVRNSFTDNKIDWYIIFSFCWISCSYVYFFRLFYNRETNCLAKTLPNTKKIYTKKLPTIFCLITSSVEILLGIAYLISYLQEKTNPIFYLIFLLYCCFHLLVAFEIKLLITSISHEQPITMWGTGFTKSAMKLLGVVFGTAGILAVITLPLSHFHKIITTFFTEYFLIFVIFCIGLIITSWIFTFRIFYKLYNKR